MGRYDKILATNIVTAERRLYDFLTEACSDLNLKYTTLSKKTFPFTFKGWDFEYLGVVKNK